jgi:hypothetical protein
MHFRPMNPRALGVSMHSRPTNPRALGLWILAAGGCAALAATALSLPIQAVLVSLGLLIAVILQNRIAVVALVVLLIPTISLIRRLAAGDSGYRESDPLLLLPIVLGLGVVAVSLIHRRIDRSRRFTRIMAVAVVAGVLMAVVLRTAFDLQSLYFAGLITVPLLLAVALSTGRMVSVWTAMERLLPPVAAFAGTYGIYQFFLLPKWDEAWMYSTMLTSIGQPYPRLVRIFGASESPGPYAFFLALVITLCLARVVVKKQGVKPVGWVLLAAYLTFPLLLSGVRSALIGVVIAAFVLAFVRARGGTRILLVAFLVGGYLLLVTILARLGEGSSILAADRYTQFSAEDDSLIQRLNLFSIVANPLRYVVGDPNTASLDNLYIDTLVRFGLMPAVALLLLVLGVVGLSLRDLVAKRNEAAALCAVFVATQTLFGPTFHSLTGTLVGIVFGTVMAMPRIPWNAATLPSPPLAFGRARSKLAINPR